jgi:hypothetical protein
MAITLAWRLPGTLHALHAGMIDLSRAKLIAEATSVLGDDAARAVQDTVLPSAGEQTMGQLRAALRQAVISVDPRGAERRRQEAESACSPTRKAPRPWPGRTSPVPIQPRPWHGSAHWPRR